MALVRVPKNLLIEALKKERIDNLQPGNWFEPTNSENIRARECIVCAVGSIFRRAICHPKSTVEDLGYLITKTVDDRNGPYSHMPSDEGVASALETANYFMALSNFYEKEYLDMPAPTTHFKKKLKRDCISFIKEFFPEEILMWTHSVEPHPNLKVVE